jgi:hypothetical protein
MSEMAKNERLMETLPQTQDVRNRLCCAMREVELAKKLLRVCEVRDRFVKSVAANK